MSAPYQHPVVVISILEGIITYTIAQGEATVIVLDYDELFDGADPAPLIAQLEASIYPGNREVVQQELDDLALYLPADPTA